MKKAKAQKSEDDFIAPARRAFRRVARRLRAENKRLGLPLIIGDKGRIRRVSLKGSSSSDR
jgi:hypothetical protein